ncbi:hypothetical protein BD410DRAFT_804502 [Rickenella mellea]|uniref:Uncharacterized protein n=1 Tax=Rickenella mellea TaxID=50990 RepID=A0A4Y7Q1N6_9AGAM|nr:hypothetical protein BD410DRAFT_804502 [Rickenella mellea]
MCVRLNFVLHTVLTTDADNLGFNGPMHNLCWRKRRGELVRISDSMPYGGSHVKTRGWLIAVPMQVVLAIRAFAIWQCDRRVAGVLLLGMCSYWIALVFCSIKAAIGTRYAPSVLTTVLRECYSTASLTGTPKEIKLAFGALLSLDGIMFFLILLRALITDRTSRIQIVNVLLRDGTIYYSVIFGTFYLTYDHSKLIANVVLATTLPFERVVLSISVSNALLAAQSIGASHIILTFGPITIPEHYALCGQTHTHRGVHISGAANSAGQ